MAEKKTKKKKQKQKKNNKKTKTKQKKKKKKKKQPKKPEYSNILIYALYGMRHVLKESSLDASKS